MTFNLEKAVTAVRTLMAMGIKPDSFTIPIETKCEIENAAIQVTEIVVAQPLSIDEQLLRYGSRFTFCGIPVNVTR